MPVGRRPSERKTAGTIPPTARTSPAVRCTTGSGRSTVVARGSHGVGGARGGWSGQQGSRAAGRAGARRWGAAEPHLATQGGHLPRGRPPLNEVDEEARPGVEWRRWWASTSARGPNPPCTRHPTPLASAWPECRITAPPLSFAPMRPSNRLPTKPPQTPPWQDATSARPNVHKLLKQTHTRRARPIAARDAGHHGACPRINGSSGGPESDARAPLAWRSGSGRQGSGSGIDGAQRRM